MESTYWSFTIKAGNIMSYLNHLITFSSMQYFSFDNHQYINQTVIIKILCLQKINHRIIISMKALKCYTFTGNDIGQWRTFQELHRGEFIRRVKAMKAKKQVK